jgi:hypothetical protein
MKVRLELVPRIIDGESCATPMVTLRVRDRFGGLVAVPFRVDTQADVATMPITLAQKEAIPFTTARPGTARGLTGSVMKFRDRLRVMIAGREHDWACDFVEPAQDPLTQRPLRDLPPVLGRAGFLNDYAITIDGGFLTITRTGPIRRWLRGMRHRLWRWFGRIHPLDQPL